MFGRHPRGEEGKPRTPATSVAAVAAVYRERAREGDRLRDAASCGHASGRRDVPFSHSPFSKKRSLEHDLEGLYTSLEEEEKEEVEDGGSLDPLSVLREISSDGGKNCRRS